MNAVRRSLLGKTQRQLKCRMSQHVTRRIFYYNSISEDNFEIWDRLNSKNGLSLLETLHKKIKRPKICVHDQSTPLLCFE